MSLSSRPKKVKPRGIVQELKIVDTVTRRGLKTIKAVEVTPARHGFQNEPSTSKCSPISSIKRRKVEFSDVEPIPYHMEGPDITEKRQTLVFLFLMLFKFGSDCLKGQNDYLSQFLVHEKTYLHHLLNLEMPPSDLSCSACSKSDARFRCLDCFGPHWFCQRCLIKTHSMLPFHRPQQWKEGSFENVSLCDLGYVFILGHFSEGRRCPEEDNLFGDRRMTVIHVNGVFEHCFRFCRCKGAISEHEQLFNHRLFSSTFDRPETAFTLDVLDYYLIDAMECKTSAEGFFQKLRRVTNNAFPDEVPVCSFLIFNSRKKN